MYKDLNRLCVFLLQTQFHNVDIVYGFVGSFALSVKVISTLAYYSYIQIKEKPEVLMISVD